MWSIIGLIGLFVSFSGAVLLVLSAVKSQDEIVEEAKPSLPVGAFDSKTYKDSIRKMPHVQALFRQAKVAKWGLWIITIGFCLQFIGSLTSQLQ